MAKFIKHDSGYTAEEAAVVTSAGAADSGKLAELDSTGRFDATVIPAAVGSDIFNVETTEALFAGDYVDIFSDGGTPKARLADASDISTKASGYVLEDFDADTEALVFLSGINDELSGLSPGTTYYLSTSPGAVTSTAPSAIGEIVQIVGTSINNKSIPLQLSNPVVVS